MISSMGTTVCIPALEFFNVCAMRSMYWVSLRSSNSGPWVRKPARERTTAANFMRLE